MQDLLIELYSEEIPAGLQKAAAESICESIIKKLSEQKLSHGKSEVFYSPQRIALIIKDIPENQPDVTIERKGPRTNAPAQAIEGFLKSTGLSLAELTVEGDTYFAKIEQKGRDSKLVLAEIANSAIAGYTWPKSMRWGEYEVRWVRPLHSIIAIYGTQILDVSYGHIKASNHTVGHRFMSANSITINHASEYVEKLLANKVIVNQNDRKNVISKQIADICKENNVTLREDANLLDEINNLVEYPVAIIGRIHNDFMALPEEVLMTVMKNHQRYLSVSDKSGKMAPYFITVSNVKTADNQQAIIQGNERVIRARLWDAKFFWESDIKTPLMDNLSKLDNIVYHAKLGSVGEKVNRIVFLAIALCKVTGCDVMTAEKAALLAKTDLVSGMVGEFGELQGIMGGYYAKAQGESDDIAIAIKEHYKPQGANDDVPTNKVSVTIALADKIDSLVSLWSVGEKPTGSRDPFALRRSAIAIIRLIITNKLSFNLREFLAAEPSIVNEIEGFMIDRLKVILKDMEIRHDYIDSVIGSNKQSIDIYDIYTRANALKEFLKTDEGINLLSAYKRADNISAEHKEFQAIDVKICNDTHEKELAKAIEELQISVDEHLKKRNYIAAMQELSKVHKPLESFFNNVMVNSDDMAVRNNRLSILKAAVNLTNVIADFRFIES